MMKTFTRHELRDSVRPERLKAVMEFGFTEPQARFLVHVLIFSGVFIERQYRAFTGIKHGQKTKDFLTKLVNRGYATAITPGNAASRTPLPRPVQAALRGDRRGEQPQPAPGLDRDGSSSD